MRVFDIHSDMLYDLHRRSAAGIKNRFHDFHVKELKNSAVKAAVWTMYSPDDFDLFEGLKIALSEIKIEELPGFEVILGLEGLRNLKCADDIDKLYEMGFRHAMLTWNEENIFATGAKANPESGLKPEGVKLLKRMQELGMIIDLAHLNQKSFFEALEVIDKDYPHVVYSHGCVMSLCKHVRNLTDEQMIALKNRKGMFGLTLANNFVSENKEEQDLEHFLNHVDYAVKMMGIDNICFGFDFMNYLSEFPNSNIKDVPDATKAHLILEGLKKRGYSDDEVDKIAFSNFYNRFKDMIVLRG